MRLASPLAVRLITGIAAVALAAPVAVGLATTEEAKRSRQLNRPLVDWPAAESLAEAPGAAVRQALDHLGDRAVGVIAAAKAASRLRTEVLGDTPAANVIRDGPFFYLTDHHLAGTQPEFSAITASCRTGGFDAPWVLELRRRVLALTKAAAAPGRKIGFLAVPSKPVLYADSLPPSVPPKLRRACALSRAKQPWARVLEAAAREGAFTFVYPLERFEAARDERHFYPPENFHADGKASHIASWSLLQRMYPGEFVPGAPGYALETADADMASIFLYAREILEDRPQYGPRAARLVPRRSREIRAEHPGMASLRVYRRGGKAEGRRGLVIGNSFSLHLIKDIATGFDETVLIDTNGISPANARRIFAEVIPSYAPDAVMFVYHDAGFKRDGNAFRRMVRALEAGD